MYWSSLSGLALVLSQNSLAPSLAALPLWLHVVCLDFGYLGHIGTQHIDVFIKLVFVRTCLFTEGFQGIPLYTFADSGLKLRGRDWRGSS